MRDHIVNMVPYVDDLIREHIVKYQHDIPTYELIRSCVSRITVFYDHLLIDINALPLQGLFKEHLDISFTLSDQKHSLKVAYQSKRGKDGAIIIELENKDLFDLPTVELKKLVQGIVWRDEHFTGMHIKDIAIREKCSDRYVRNAIMHSFDILSNA